MESPKFRVCYRSKQLFLTMEVTIVDTINESLKSMVGDLALKSEGALWLKPYRGIPVTPGFPAFEIIYLDENLRVLQEVESFPSPIAPPLKKEPTSAVVLAPHTVFAAIVKPGDQLSVLTLDEVEAIRISMGGESASKQDQPAEVSSLPVKPSAAMPEPPAGDAVHDSSFLQPAQEKTWLARLWHWLTAGPRERRKANRYPLPGLVGYHWSGSTPVAHLVGNISRTGFFLVTEERPMPGTRLLMTLQRTGSSGYDPDDVLAVQSRVVRWGPDGLGFELLPVHTSHDKGGGDSLNQADSKAIKHFLKQLDLERLTPPAA